MRIIPNFPVKTLKARRTWIDVRETLRDHRDQPRILYTEKLSITIHGKENTIHGKENTLQDKVRFKHQLSRQK